jgi:hypothetical protein
MDALGKSILSRVTGTTSPVSDGAERAEFSSCISRCEGWMNTAAGQDHHATERCPPSPQSAEPLRRLCHGIFCLFAADSLLDIHIGGCTRHDVATHPLTA